MYRLGFYLNSNFENLMPLKVLWVYLRKAIEKLSVTGNL